MSGRNRPAEKCKHLFFANEWKIYDDPIKNEVHIFNVCRKCRKKYAMAYPKEEFLERWGSNNYSSIIKAIVAEIEKKEGGGET